MLAQERHQIILELLRRDNVVKVVELAKLFNVSIETIRRDLDFLEKEALLKKVYGGAVSIKKLGIEPSYTTREVANLEEKKAIGRKCSELIEDGDTIILDLGTTTLEVAKNLIHKKDLTIITNSLNIAMELVKVQDFRVFLAGGLLRSVELTCSGFLTQEFINNFNVDKTIIGVGGITLENGITDYHVDEAQARKAMIQRGNKVIAVADYSKFGVKAFCNICTLDEVDVLITDWKVDERTLKKYRNKKLEVIRAEKPE